MANTWKMFPESYRASEFVIEVGGIKSPGFTKVTGLSEGDAETIEQKDGGSNIVYTIATGVIKFENLTLERNMDGTSADQKFKEWFEKIFNLDGSGANASKTKQTGSVIKKHFGKEVMRFTFYNAWVKSSKFSDLEAGSEKLLKQTIVLVHEGLERVK